MFFILQSPDLHIFGSRSLCQVFFKQSWLMNSRDRWGCLFYILKLWTSDTLWFSKLHHQFSPGCSQWGQGCSAHIDLFNISHCMWLQTPFQKVYCQSSTGCSECRQVNHSYWSQLITWCLRFVVRFSETILIQLLFSLITKLTYCQHPWWLVVVLCLCVCLCVSMLVYVCVMHFQELKNRTLLAARRGHEMSLKMLKFIFGWGTSPPWAPLAGCCPCTPPGPRRPLDPAWFQWIFSKAIPMPVGSPPTVTGVLAVMFIFISSVFFLLILSPVPADVVSRRVVLSCIWLWLCDRNPRLSAKSRSSSYV